MSTIPTMSGVLSPVVTPFKADLSPDADKLLAHCRWLLSQGCGLAVFGTNSEGNSLSVDERIALLEALVDGGIDPARMMPGTGCCALSDTVRLTKRAVELGCGGVLMLPPFFYKGVSDTGLHRSFAEVMDRVDDARLRVYLYHIPPVAQVGISLNLIEMLRKSHGAMVAGVKDSSGDWENTRAMLEAFPGWGIFSGNELVLLKALKMGGMGCISATANVNPAAIRALYDQWRSPQADSLQESVNAVRKFIQNYPVIPSLKHIVSHFTGDPAWRTLRPPLEPLEEAQGEALLKGLNQLGFGMPGLAP